MTGSRATATVGSWTSVVAGSGATAGAGSLTAVSSSTTTPVSTGTGASVPAGSRPGASCVSPCARQNAGAGSPARCSAADSCVSCASAWLSGTSAQFSCASSSGASLSRRPQIVMASSSVGLVGNQFGEQLGKVDAFPAEMPGLDLGAAGEPVGQHGNLRARVPYGRPQPVLRAGHGHLVVPGLEADDRVLVAMHLCDGRAAAHDRGHRRVPASLGEHFGERPGPFRQQPGV